VHACKEHHQLAGQPIRPQPESTVGHHHDHFQVLHLEMQLGKAGGLGPEAMLKPRLALRQILRRVWVGVMTAIRRHVQPASPT